VPVRTPRVLDDAGHMVHMEKPSEVLAAIRSAMAAAPAGG